MPFSLLCYVLAIITFYPVLGGPLFAISVIPVSVIAVFGGVKAGVLIGPFFLILNWLLLVSLGKYNSFTMFASNYGLINAITISVVGGGIGYVASLNKQLNKEIAGRELAQRSLDELNQKLERQTQQALQARSHFLTAMSHKLRTPLNASAGMSTLLLDTELDAKQRDYVSDVVRSNNEVIDIINSILEYTKVESGGIELNIVTFELSSLLEQLIDPLRLKAEENCITLHTEIDTQVPSQVRGDSRKLMLILQNLLNNSFNATQNGHISISVTQVTPADSTAVQAPKSTTTIQFEIVDTGRGIHPNDLNSLFEPFDSAYETTISVGVGAGIGLALCRRLCNYMGGNIQVKSVLDEGTTVVLTVPLEPVVASEHSAPSHRIYTHQTMPQTVSTPDKLRVLLAEDNVLNAKVALKLLEKLNVAAHWVKDGQEAVDAVAASPYDLILMDIQMPRLDGLQATQQIRKQFHSRSQSQNGPTIIALTADTTLEDFSKQKAYGFDGFLSKPVSLQMLQKALSIVTIDMPTVSATKTPVSL